MACLRMRTANANPQTSNRNASCAGAQVSCAALQNRSELGSLIPAFDGSTRLPVYGSSRVRLRDHLQHAGVHRGPSRPLIGPEFESRDRFQGVAGRAAEIGAEVAYKADLPLSPDLLCGWLGVSSAIHVIGDEAT
jgi:hypothetical protein